MKVSFSTSTINHNYSQPKFKRDNHNRNENNQTKKSTTNSRIKTGALITTAAFLAGMGTGKVITSATPAKANNIETVAHNNSETPDDGNTITWEEATNSQQQSNKNIPPSDKQRTWTKTSTFSANGEQYVAENKYLIKEVPFLVEQKVTNANTNKLEQKNTFANYTLVPTKVEARDAQNKLIEKREINNIDVEYGAPESAKFTVYNPDGSTHITNIRYKMEMEFSDTKPKVQPKQEQRDHNLDALRDYIFN